MVEEPVAVAVAVAVAVVGVAVTVAVAMALAGGGGSGGCTDGDQVIVSNRKPYCHCEERNSKL